MSAREGAIQPYRVEFARESTAGEAPSDPSWTLFSDNVRSIEPSIDPQITAQEGLGDPDATGSFAGTEQPELTISYDLQQWLIDGSSNPQDASYDGVARNSDNRLPNTHTFVRRMTVSSVDGSNTINGSTSKDTRLYLVGRGGRVDEVVFTMNIDSGQPILVELSYVFERLRVVQIDQPGSSTTIDVESTDDSDDSQTVTIEGVDDTGSAAEEDVSLDGTTTATSTTSFQSIDAIELSDETVGDVQVSENGSDQLAVLYGQSSYDQGEGDLGVPALGSGSHASALGSGYELPLDGDAWEFPTGTSMAPDITTQEVSVANNVEARSTNDGARPDLSEGGREAEVSATVFGETETYQQHEDLVRTNVQNYQWTASDPSGDTGSVEFTDMAITEVGESEEAREDVIEVDVTLAQQKGVSVS